MQGAAGRKIIWISILAAVAILVLLGAFADRIVEWLWMRQLGYESVFWRLLFLKLALFGTGFCIAFFYLFFNLRFFLRPYFPQISTSKEIVVFGEQQLAVPPGLFNRLVWIVSGGAGLFFGIALAESWDAALRFIWRVPFGRTDPVYSKDLGFYLFKLPFYELLQNNAALLAFLVFGLILGLIFLLNEGEIREVLRRRHRGFRQASFCFFIFLFAWSWGYYLDRFQLLFSQDGAVYGAGWTDLHVVRIGLWFMIIASLLLAVLIAFDAFYRKPLLSLLGIGGYVLAGILALKVVPVVVQSFMVVPNELEKETPYLRSNIEMTRFAYGLHNIKAQEFPFRTDLTLQEVQADKPTISNVRLWDWRPLLETYRQMQEIRLYYQFYEVDVERYHLGDGSYRQVMASARELSQELPGRTNTWVNRILQFTHGYGIVMSLASQEGAEGVPDYLIKDVPPVATEGLQVKQPAIYYGENLPVYKIVNSKAKELDYPKGDQNVYTHYQGRGGVLLDSWWKKALFAWELSDVNIILSGYIRPESRIQIWHRVQDRIRRIAPFFRLDSDPYIVLGKKGRLFWIQDLYTTSSTFPYSEPYRHSFNYIRNSVKAVMDAYNGSVDFYVIDPKDPVLQVYRAAFPELFKDLAALPAGLKPHLRYPSNLFTVQVGKYNRYHMTIPQVFYNNEDLWTFSREKYAGRAIPMEPYYILIRLPESDRLEFLLMTPLTPSGRNNMIAWLAARCDFPGYGEMVVYKLPKERLIYGPMQIEAMIDQDAKISSQLSLWDQRGSRVIRGNLLVIPIDHSFLYVEPVYLIAEETNLPQLRRVIVAYGDRVAMEPTLAEAVRAVFGVLPKAPAAAAPEAAPKTPMASELRKSMRRAQEALKKGDWEAFGRAMEQLQQKLEEQQK
jgi:uncharacterized membrane protein (UPF0182 family)